MTNYLRISALAVAISMVAACNNDDPAATSAAAEQAAGATSEQTATALNRAAAASPLLSYVPADTPYFAVNPQPMPALMTDLIWQQIDSSLSIGDEAMKRAQRKPASASKSKLAEAWQEVFAGKLNRAGFEELGLAPGDYYAIYGVGVLPVARVSLTDADKLLATIDDFAERAELELSSQQLGPYQYYLLGEAFAAQLGKAHAEAELEINGQPIDVEDEVRLLIAVGDGQLVVSALPDEPAESLLRQVIGVDKPNRPLTAAAVRTLNREFDFGPYGTALFDTTRIAEHVLQDDTPQALAWFGDLREDVSPACRDEVIAMTKIAPRAVAGYGEISDDRFESLAVFELRDDIAAAVEQITLDIPAAAAGDLFGLSVGFDLLKAKQFVLDRLAAIEASPFACERFADLNNTDELRQTLSQPIPPFISTIKGLSLSVGGLEFGPDGDPVDGKGLAMVMMENPQLILGMGQMFVPELAQVDVPSDGTPVELPLASLAVAGVPPLHLAMTDAGIGLAIGKDQANQLGDFVDMDQAAEGTLLSFGYDVKAFTELQLASARKELDSNPDLGEEGDLMLEWFERIEKSVAGMERVSGDVMLTRRGVEIASVTELDL